MLGALVVRDIRYPAVPDHPGDPCPPPPPVGVVTPSAGTVRAAPRPRPEVLAGFSTQQVRLEVCGRLVVFTRSEQAGAFPFAEPVLLIGGRRDEGPQPVVEHRTALALAADRAWIDPLWVVAADQPGWEFAHQAGQRFVVRWDVRGMQLHDLRAGATSLRWRVRGLTLPHRCCPFIPDAVAGQMCVPDPAGPVTPAMARRMRWRARRATFVEHAGCDEACGDVVPGADDLLTRYERLLSPPEVAPAERHNDGACRLCHRADGTHVLGPVPVVAVAGTVVIRSREGVSTQVGLEEPLVLSRGQIVEVGGGISHVARMLVDPAGGDEDPLDWSDPCAAWIAGDADLNACFTGLDFVHRWAVVGALRVSAVRLGDSVVPMAFDLRIPSVVPPRVLMRVGQCVVGQARGWTIAHRRVGQGGRCWTAPMSGAPESAVADWLIAEDLEHLAALVLEPLDPAGSLTMLERQWHLHLLAHVLGDVRLDVCADVVAGLLRGRERYARARAALARPDHQRGFWDSLWRHARNDRGLADLGG